MTDTALSGAGASPASTPRRSFLLDPSVLLLAVTVLAAAALLTVEISRAFGLPAHPLLLHMPVVLTPMLSLIVIALAVRPTWRLQYGLAVGIFAFVTMAATILTSGAGEALKDEQSAQIPGPSAAESVRLEEHAELGEQLRLLLMVLAVVFIVLVILDRYRAHTSEGLLARSAVANVVAAVAVVLAVVSAIWVVRTGHAGAQITWRDG